MDSPGSAVDKKPPANAGDTDSIPGPGRSHLPMQVTQIPSLVQEDPICHRATTQCVTTTEPLLGVCKPQLLKPMLLEPALCNKISHCDEKPTHSS